MRSYENGEEGYKRGRTLLHKISTKLVTVWSVLRKEYYPDHRFTNKYNQSLANAFFTHHCVDVNGSLNFGSECSFLNWMCIFFFFIPSSFTPLSWLPVADLTLLSRRDTEQFLTKLNACQPVKILMSTRVF